jgi:hypothetical protein
LVWGRENFCTPQLSSGSLGDFFIFTKDRVPHFDLLSYHWVRAARGAEKFLPPSLGLEASDKIRHYQDLRFFVEFSVGINSFAVDPRRDLA